MRQPEMRPGGGARKGSGTGRAGRGGGRSGSGRRGDLLGLPFPVGDWGEPTERLAELYARAEQGALRIVEWYLTDRVAKRRAARALRAGAATGLIVGTALPLLEVTGAVPAGCGAWSGAALLGAVICVGGDRCFGLTAGWLRDVATAQAVQRRLEQFQYDWAAESVREALGPAEGTAAEAAERGLGMMRRFAEDVTEIVRAETAAWMAGFGTGGAPLRPQPTGTGRPVLCGESGEAGEGGGCGGYGGYGGRGSGSGNGLPTGPRFTLPPGTRPSMPRQRPPEGPPR